MHYLTVNACECTIFAIAGHYRFSRFTQLTTFLAVRAIAGPIRWTNQLNIHSVRPFPALLPAQIEQKYKKNCCAQKSDGIAHSHTNMHPFCKMLPDCSPGKGCCQWQQVQSDNDQQKYIFRNGQCDHLSRRCFNGIRHLYQRRFAAQ